MKRRNKSKPFVRAVRLRDRKGRFASLGISQKKRGRGRRPKKEKVYFGRRSKVIKSSGVNKTNRSFQQVNRVLGNFGMQDVKPKRQKKIPAGTTNNYYNTTNNTKYSSQRVYNVDNSTKTRTTNINMKLAGTMTFGAGAIAIYGATRKKDEQKKKK
jgi:hypothetical protein